MADFTLRGVDNLHHRLREIDQQSRDSLSEAATEEAEMIVQRAKDEFVPVDSGNLREKIRVLIASALQGRDTGGRFTESAVIEIRVVAGDETTPQALAVHEHPGPHDPPSWQGGNVKFNPSGRGPKFLQRPLEESISGMANRVASKVKLS